ncbi:MAG: Mur ligase family protein [Planctomycetota bacterium]
MTSRFEALQRRLDARIDWEKLDRSKGWRVDLAPIRDLVERLGRPDRALRVVHVAGSKGKGSTASLVAAGLRRAGHRVGVFASPHVETIRERISMGDGPLGEDAFAAAGETVLDAIEAAPEGAAAREASWFDVMCATALVAFQSAGAEWAVLEVGLGGRLDSTNVIDVPEVAVVTMIALEHTAVLGDTHAKIAAEKGGIIKAGGLVVSGCPPDGEAGRTLAGIAAERGSEIVFVQADGEATFEARNREVACAVLAALGSDPGLLDDETTREARLPGRQEHRVRGGVDVVLDGAHVDESVAQLVEESVRARGAGFVAVVAVHREKDAAALLAPLARTCALVVATSVPKSRVHGTADGVADAARRHGLDVATIADPLQALDRAVEEARQRGAWVLATGSLYLVGALRAATEPPA